MANNTTVNKVILGSNTLIDLTSDTVTASDVASGVTFHLPSGASGTGTLAFQTIYTGSSDPSASTGSDGDIYLKVVS